MKKKDNDKKTVVISGDKKTVTVESNADETTCVIDALKELTKTVADLAKKQNEMLRIVKAGKF